MKKAWVGYWAAWLFVGLLATQPAVAQPQGQPATESSGLRIEETDARISIYRGEAPLLVYNKQSPAVPAGIDPIYARSGFLHPVYSPAGQVVTAAFPIDHAHQHGIFSAWVKTNYDGQQVDFWNLAAGSGRVVHERVIRTFRPTVGTGFQVEMLHQMATEPKVDVLRESWKVVAYPTDGSYHCFDIESLQQAVTDLPLVIEKYHYGGMALRGRVEWVQKEKLKNADGELLVNEPSDFLNDRGSTRQQGNHERARWVTLHGDLADRVVSISVLSHADNFRAPQPARLHPTKPYFCFTPCVDEPFVIDRQHPLQARYRYLVTDASPDPQWIEEQWRRYVAQ